MVLESKVYIPTLAVRASEMNGLEFLPAATKNRMTPCFLLAPWANSTSLERAVARIERAFPNRPYLLDLDRDYMPTNLDSPAQQEFLQLLDPRNGYANWVAFVGEHENVWPCVQTRGITEPEIAKQIEAFQAQGRPYCMRIVRDPYPDNVGDIIGAFSASGSADFAIVLEGGWTRDPLMIALWFSGFIAESLDAVDASVPVVLSCTSIPKMFDAYNSSAPVRVPFSNRLLVDQVARGSNRTRIIYGDWGSTRPRERRDMASRPLDRIDYPTDSSWLIARNKDARWDFRDAAEAVVSNGEWNGNLGIWGEELIRNTIINKELGIDTPQKNVASRVNIHLHRQAFYGQPPLAPIALDEDWED